MAGIQLQSLTAVTKGYLTSGDVESSEQRTTTPVKDIKRVGAPSRNMVPMHLHICRPAAFETNR